MNNIKLTKGGDINMGGKILSFKFDVEEYIDFGNIIVIRLRIPIEIILNENVFGLNEEGKVVWQIEHKELMHKNSPYTNITKIDSDRLRLNNWDGTQLLVNPINGKILDEKWFK